MGVLADWQIGKEIYIDPFVDSQVSPGVISYGVSSYGYDLRVGRKFKVFTNARCAIVDPKNFDPLSFIDIEADYCLIPPNSFALAETVEFVSIPRGIIGVCVGKCLTGDTRVFYPEDGAFRRLDEHDPGDNVLAATFSASDRDRMQVSSSSGLVRNGKRPVFVLTTHSGARIKATANHPFMKYGPDGGWTPLENLKVGDEIAAAGYLPFFGNEGTLGKHAIRLMALMIADGQCKTPGSSPGYSKQDPVLVAMLKKAVASVLACPVTQPRPHHYRIVNHEGRGGVQTKNRATAWLQAYRLDRKAADKHVPADVFRQSEKSIAEFLRVLFTGDGSVFLQNKKRKTPTVVIEYSSASRRLCEDIQHLLLRFGIRGTLREKLAKGKMYHKYTVHRKADISRFFDTIGFVTGSFKDTFYKESVSRYVDHPATVEQVANVVPDKIVSIVAVGEEEVYDIEVPRLHNFVAENLIVHNSTYARCGVILNITPIEPEWKGKITLEISNTTPLPAKIYANEGIAQLLFFRGEEVCKVSYADKKGKYQSQQGIQLPFVVPHDDAF